MSNNKGVVLIMVLWVLVILSLIAWGMGRRSSLEVSLITTYRGKLHSYAAARAGISHILDLLQKSPSIKDTLYSVGIAIDVNKSPVDVFSHMDVDNKSYAVIQWRASQFNTGDDKPVLEYGLRDEEGKININAINIANYQMLSALLQLQGLSQAEGDKLALAIVNYAGINATVSTNSTFLQLDTSTIKPKNRHFENILELLEVDGMTKGIFDKIKDDVTVYGDTQNGLWINTNTASNNVIQAIANTQTRLNPSINATDIVNEAYTIRDGADGRSFTSDDGVGSIASINDPNWPSVLQEGKSNYYSARVVGVDRDSGTRSAIDVVIRQTPGASGEIISWNSE